MTHELTDKRALRRANKAKREERDRAEYSERESAQIAHVAALRTIKIEANKIGDADLASLIIRESVREMLCAELASLTEFANAPSRIGTTLSRMCDRDETLLNASTKLIARSRKADSELDERVGSESFRDALTSELALYCDRLEREQRDTVTLAREAQRCERTRKQAKRASKAKRKQSASISHRSSARFVSSSHRHRTDSIACPMSHQRFQIVVNHGESTSVFSLVDSHAPEPQQPAVIDSGTESREAMQVLADHLNAAHARGDDLTPVHRTCCAYVRGLSNECDDLAGCIAASACYLQGGA